ncbi:glycoside hydrolase family 6 protein [Nonomuraea sp. SYSU D8015]|uniref:glycoside hydrolase family 6 protein n=1 Tax=Nonomuraea sp. SYSU D8015 TaxID=2593644 RepID=UPI0016604DA1|nr:glycoside hydrolase family 6 protein [Nonomuraea sp. SYSU D8015]
MAQGTKHGDAVDTRTSGDPPQIAGHRVIRRLGAGGMGVVYLAQNRSRRLVAIKVIHRHLAGDPEFRRRFRREVATARRVARFSTAPVLDADLDGDTAYVITEYVPGPTLYRAVKEWGPMSGSELDGLAMSTAVALGAIHAAGVVHRDLKPSNVLLSPVGPKVIDFGLAFAADSTTLSVTRMGTPAYMSPEQVRGLPLSPASDVFAWGGVMVFAASGRPPFGSGQGHDVLYRVIHDDPVVPALDGVLGELVWRALSKDPAARPTAAELVDALSGGITTRLPPLVVPPGPGARPGSASGDTPLTLPGNADREATYAPLRSVRHDAAYAPPRSASHEAHRSAPQDTTGLTPWAAEENGTGSLPWSAAGDPPGALLWDAAGDEPASRPWDGAGDAPRSRPWEAAGDAPGVLRWSAPGDVPAISPDPARGPVRRGPATAPALAGAPARGASRRGFPGADPRQAQPIAPEPSTGTGRRRRRRRPAYGRRVLGGAALALVAVATVLVSQAVTDGGPLVPGLSERPSGISALTEKAGARWRELPGQNPLRAGDDVRFYVQPDTEAAQQARTWSVQGRTADAALMRALSEVPAAIWLAGGEPADVSRTVREAVTRAARQRTVPVFVTNNIPARDCWNGGAPNAEAYRAWIDAVAEGIGNRSAVVALEPSGLARMPGSPECPQGGQAAATQRYSDLSYAVEALTGLGSTAVYLDGGLAGWPGFTQMADRLVNAGAVRADGFYVNVVGYRTTEQSLTYASQLSKCVYLRAAARTASCAAGNLAAVPDDAPGLPHFVVDTSRNGTGEWQPPAGRFPAPDEWCNPPGRGAGARPTTDTRNSLADALLWLNSPGFSNGQCTRGTSGPADPAYGIVTPAAGQWWPDQALERARNAVPPLTP